MSGIAAMWAGKKAIGRIKAMAIGIAATAVMTTLGLLIWQNSSLREENKVLSSNNGILKSAVDQQRQTIERAVEVTKEWESHMDEFQNRLDELARVQRAAAAETRRLNDVFVKHDLEKLSLAKPGLVERAINSGTHRVLGMFEHATGGDTDDTGGSEAAGRSTDTAQPGAD